MGFSASTADNMTAISNLTFEQIDLGAALVIHHTVSRNEVELMALVSGESSPFALSDEAVDTRAQVAEPVCEGVSAEALIHGMLKRRLPGPGTVILSHQLAYGGTVRAGDELIATVTLVDKEAPDQLTFDCQGRRGDDRLLSGSVTVRAPCASRDADPRDALDVVLRRNDVFGRLFRQCEALAPVSCAVVHPCDAASLGGALEAARQGLMVPVLVGPEAKIRAVAAAQGWDLSGHRLVPTEHSHASAEVAVAMARSGEVKALMKGSLHTDELMAAVVPSATG